MQKSNRGKPGTRALLKVMFITVAVILLLAVAAPRFLDHAELARENHLRENLGLLRATIQQYRLDHGHYPPSLQGLVTAHYLRQIPKDPFTDRNDAWIVTVTPFTNADGAGVMDVHSGAMGQSRSGTPYDRW